MDGPMTYRSVKHRTLHQHWQRFAKVDQVARDNNYNKSTSQRRRRGVHERNKRYRQHRKKRQSQGNVDAANTFECGAQAGELESPNIPIGVRKENPTATKLTAPNQNE